MFVSDTAPTKIGALVIGESLLDVVELGDGQVAESLGGSPFNVAIGLGRLGVSTTLVTGIGDDGVGAMVRDALQAAGVELHPGSVRPGPSAVSRAALRPDGSADYRFENELSVSKPVSLPSAAIIHIGSIALFAEPGATSWKRGFKELGANALITLDPNIRTTFLSDSQSARAHLQQFLPGTDVIKLSDEDAAWLYPQRSPADVLADLRAAGPSVAIMTLGAEGALLSTRATLVRVRTPATVVTDTIGAGDSYMSALIDGLLRSLSTAGSVETWRRDADNMTEDALVVLGAAASAAAAITVSRRGANPPWHSELTAV